MRYMTFSKNGLYFVAIIIFISLVFVVSRYNVEIRDAVLNHISEDNYQTGVFEYHELEWCDLPIGYDLDRCGVPNGIKDVTHPSVVYVECGWNGADVWMAATPYPTSLRVSGEPYENTSIFYATTDSTVAPTTFDSIERNPIIYKQGAQYNSDPDIFFNDKDSIMYVVTRKRRGEDYLTRMVIQSSVDGHTWSTPTTLFDTEQLALSPSIIAVNDTTYRIYTFNTLENATKTTESMVIWESPSLRNPSFNKVKEIAWNSRINFWHGDVIKHEGKYYMLFCGTNEDFKWKYTRGYVDQAKYLWFADSDDGINFNVYQRPLVKMGGFYRSTFYIDENRNVTIYSALHNRYRGDKKCYPSGNRIAKLQFSLDDLYDAMI